MTTCQENLRETIHGQLSVESIEGLASIAKRNHANVTKREHTTLYVVHGNSDGIAITFITKGTSKH